MYRRTPGSGFCAYRTDWAATSCWISSAVFLWSNWGVLLCVSGISCVFRRRILTTLITPPQMNLIVLSGIISVRPPHPPPLPLTLMTITIPTRIDCWIESRLFRALTMFRLSWGYAACWWNGFLLWPPSLLRMSYQLNSKTDCLKMVEFLV